MTWRNSILVTHVFFAAVVLVSAVMYSFIVNANKCLGIKGNDRGVLCYKVDTLYVLEYRTSGRYESLFKGGDRDNLLDFLCQSATSIVESVNLNVVEVITCGEYNAQEAL